MSSAFGASLPHGRRGAARMLSVSVAALCAGVGLRARWRQVETTPHSTRYPVEPPSEATNAATGAKTPFSTRSDVAAVATRETGTEGEQKDACDCGRRLQRTRCRASCLSCFLKSRVTTLNLAACEKTTPVNDGT
jgi:hypothetical protein